jgi:hypothetical protein
MDSLLEAETLNITISRLKVSSACVVKVAGNKRKITPSVLPVTGPQKLPNQIASHKHEVRGGLIGPSSFASYSQSGSACVSASTTP